MKLEQQRQALLDLVEADRSRRCAQLLDAAHAQATALLAQAHAQARARMRQAFEEQRALRRERLAAAQARLATQRRLHAQQRTAQMLALAGTELPGELQRRWQDPASRAAWVRQVLAWAGERLPRGAWRIAHPSDWPAPEQQAVAQALAARTGTAPLIEADTSIGAGLKVMVSGNCIDGSARGLLADRADFEAGLLRQLEVAA